jgi:hypothetical protein
LYIFWPNILNYGDKSVIFLWKNERRLTPLNNYKEGAYFTDTYPDDNFLENLSEIFYFLKNPIKIFLYLTKISPGLQALLQASKKMSLFGAHFCFL